MNILTRPSYGVLAVARRHLPRLTFVPKRFLGIPSAFLLDEYIPRYFLLSSVDEALKRSAAYAHLRECNLCPRKCGVNRYETTGTCLIGAETAKVNVIAPHRGEEPCIQGFHGSGSVFFSGCNLRCVFCQNHVGHLPPTGFRSMANLERTSRTNATDSTSLPRNSVSGLLNCRMSAMFTISTSSRLSTSSRRSFCRS